MLVQAHPFMTRIKRIKRSIKETAKEDLGVFGSALTGMNTCHRMQTLRMPKKVKAMIWKKKMSKEKARTKTMMKATTIIRFFIKPSFIDFHAYI